MWVLLYGAVAVLLFGAGFYFARRMVLEDRLKAEGSLRAEVETVRSTGRAAAAAERAAADAESREQLLELRRQAHDEAVKAERELERKRRV